MKKLLPNSTLEQRLEFMEDYFSNLLNDEGEFSVEEFARDFTRFRSELLYNIPSLLSLLETNPLFADQTITSKLIKLMQQPTPSTTDFIEFGKLMEEASVYVPSLGTSLTKQFAISVDDTTHGARNDVPPLGEEIIIFNPIVSGFVSAVREEKPVDDLGYFFKNNSVGGDFILAENELCWYKANRYNLPKTSEDAKIVDSINSETSELSKLIKSYFKEN